MDLFSEAMAARLRELADSSAPLYRDNRPFPHIVIDDFLPAEVLDAVLHDYPEPEQVPWIRFDNREEKKLAFNDVDRLPVSIRSVLHFMNSPTMLGFLERMTGIENLVPDPYFVGGGLHQIRRGGHLGVHVDFNKYARFDLDRRLNMLIYLNRSWEESFGGHLELWDAEMKRCEKRVLPVFNRCVVFSTSETSYHGHPDPLTCPEDRARRSLATYYYTNGRPALEAAARHSTIFRARPGTDAPRFAGFPEFAKRVALAVTPPIVVKALRHLVG
jgi:hypothetical protein